MPDRQDYPVIPTRPQQKPAPNPPNKDLETVPCLIARLVELDLLEQALNEGLSIETFKMKRLDDLMRRIATIKGQGQTVTPLNKDFDAFLDTELERFLLSHSGYKFRAQKARYNPGDKEHREAKSRITGEVERRETAYQEIFAWLLGERGDFPQSEQGKRYAFRIELRKKLDALEQKGTL